MQSTIRKILVAVLATSCMAGSALAKVSQAEADRLGKDLTPVGAEKAGNKDGTIPAWDGGLTTPPPGFKPDSSDYIDPFAGEKPLFTITAQNLDKYQSKMSVGQVAMFKKYPDFKMNVYPTHRTGAAPQQVYDCAKKAATVADTRNEGNGIVDPTSCYVPFPIPKSAQEVMLNHIMRWRGGGFEGDSSWFPVQPNGAKYKVTVHNHFIADQNMDQHKPNRFFYGRVWYTSPATLEGTVYLVHEPIDQVAESRSAWIYNAGMRRVRRVPELGYDYIADGVEGLRTVDQYDGFNGALDRYDWKLVGKKEMYVPYNNYKLADKRLKYEQIVKTGHLNTDYPRYELHRVWVVDATLKPGARHIYGRRTFYIDEDTWTLVHDDVYDTKGALWRVDEHFLILLYDHLIAGHAMHATYDLNSGAYLVDGMTNEEKPAKIGIKGRVSDFEPDSLRRLGTK